MFFSVNDVSFLDRLVIQAYVTELSVMEKNVVWTLKMSKKVDSIFRIFQILEHNQYRLQVPSLYPSIDVPITISDVSCK